MKELKFRDASLEDLPRIVEIYNSTVPSRMVTADTEPVTVESRIKWFYEHNPRNRPLWVIEHNEENGIIGWISIQSFYGRPAYSATAEISIYLDAHTRGQGIGKRLLTHSIERAKLCGIKTLLGFVFEHNEPSLRLFMSLGFEDWAHLPRIAVLDGIERGLRILGKRIVT